jgi:DNA-binding winged helix-turn-helix (wHTH) protein
MSFVSPISRSIAREWLGSPLWGTNVQFLFADHVLDTDRRELRYGSKTIAVEPQVLDLLIHLVQNRDRVVSKDDLTASIWNGRIASDATLTSRVYAARKAVGDSGRDQKLIRTIARKGYRFVGAVLTQSTADEPSVRHRMNSPTSCAQPCRSPTAPPSRCFRSST